MLLSVRRSGAGLRAVEVEFEVDAASLRSVEAEIREGLVELRGREAQEEAAVAGVGLELGRVALVAGAESRDPRSDGSRSGSLGPQ